MIKEIKHDLLTVNTQIIAHQVNCLGGVGGLAGQIARKYPENEKEYRQKCAECKPYQKNLLGNVLFVTGNDGKIIANLFGQYNTGINKRQTDYTALNQSFIILSDYMINNGFESVAFPYQLGCGLGGGDWNIVRKQIEKHFNNFNCLICKPTFIAS